MFNVFPYESNAAKMKENYFLYFDRFRGIRRKNDSVHIKNVFDRVHTIKLQNLTFGLE